MDQLEKVIVDNLKTQNERLKNIETFLSSTKKVLNIDEVSKLTSLSKSTIYKFTHSGIIPHYKQAKHLYFDKEEIEEWLKSNRGLYNAELDRKASSLVKIKKGDEE